MSPALLPLHLLQDTVLHIARMSQARNWPSLYDRALRQRAAALRLVQCPRALLAARSVVGHLCASAPRLLLHAAVARPLPCPAFSAPLPSGQRVYNVGQFALQCSLFAPSLCPGPLALSCPLSARPPSSSCAPLPRSLGPWLSVSLSSSSLYPPGTPFAEQHARHPSHSPFTLPLRGALVPCAPARCLRPSSPALPLPPSPALFPLLTYTFTLRRTRCRQVARMSQALISLHILLHPSPLKFS